MEPLAVTSDRTLLATSWISACLKMYSSSGSYSFTRIRSTSVSNARLPSRSQGSLATVRTMR